MVRYAVRYVSFVALLAALLVCPGCFRRKIYENPITKDTQQPDKVLYDAAIDDIEHGRFERARLQLQTLMNTYDTSEYLAKAKLAMADSWYREGGTRGFAQAEAEYKDFILFYKNMEEAAEAQMKICKMQFDQMDKADRDPHHALRAQDECKQLMLDFPNSKFAVEAQQYLRNVQEVLADEEHKVQLFYEGKGSYPAAANRGQALTDQFPLYSNNADALWMLADDYQHLGDRFENQQAAAYAKIVRDYPLSPHAEAAKLRLQAMNRPVPEVDPVAYARERYELENPQKRTAMGKIWDPFSSRPDLLGAARSGDPSMEPFHPGIPASVPLTAAGTQGTSAEPGVGAVSVGSVDVTGKIVDNANLVDKLPDARLGSGGTGAAAAEGAAPAGSTAPAGGTPAGGNTVTATPGAAPAAGASAPAAAAPAASTGAKGKAKNLNQQETSLKREQDQLKAERQKIQDQNKKRLELMQKMQKKQQAAQEKKKAQEDADRKRAEAAAAKRAKKESQGSTSTPAAAPAQPDKQPDKPGNGPGGGDQPPAKP
jgi:outer membrane protein assembly factor BamD